MRALLLLVVMVGLVLLGGCATMTQSSEEVTAQYGRIWGYELQQMSDDWNFAWLVDRPSRLTRWVMR